MFYLKEACLVAMHCFIFTSKRYDKIQYQWNCSVFTTNIKLFLKWKKIKCKGKKWIHGHYEIIHLMCWLVDVYLIWFPFVWFNCVECLVPRISILYIPYFHNINLIYWILFYTDLKASKWILIFLKYTQCNRQECLSYFQLEEK